MQHPAHCNRITRDRHACNYRNRPVCVRHNNPEPIQYIALLDAAEPCPAHIRASELLLSIVDNNAATLAPAYCDEQNQRFAFYDLTQTKMSCRRRHNAPTEPSRSDRIELLVMWRCIPAAGPCFSTGSDLANYRLNCFGASWPMRQQRRAIGDVALRPAQHLRYARTSPWH